MFVWEQPPTGSSGVAASSRRNATFEVYKVVHTHMSCVYPTRTSTTNMVHATRTTLMSHVSINTQNSIDRVVLVDGSKVIFFAITVRPKSDTM